MKLQKAQAFTLIELLVVISIIAILAGIALPVFGEVKIRGDQTKALSNAKQIGTACKIYATDNNGIYPHYTDYPQGTAPTPTKAAAGDSSNLVLRILIPDYLPDRAIFSIPKSAFCKSPTPSTATDPLPTGTNEWAYVSGLTDTSNSRWPILADGFEPGSLNGNPSYVTDDSLPGGLWKGKKAVVIRVDGSGVVETLYSKDKTVKRADDDNTNAFSDTPAPTGKIEWFKLGSTTEIYVHGPAK